ncbi:MAG: ABC transporter ATP-binding protein [Candidatus Marinimicrobia bacterium]|jgi:branched-chain amino acid transport system ATP-binding protein|nr:ABC transporter ATP-binding protein [Candidatus Neomarinimicrobiota bacterium]MBT3676274.1 ABC transporter ATP-binding protein [Candidatus Neomarinimicrobiota bacterium]MBT3762929.1 ABC transporter ATP-binding protein [Candidatus Neomarinimicrobiota bacterium]MBT4069502.1 ABC transporter ATP-binding protein [Candidatus Neomarinimicrobiota bacterium]MBT4270002.1 ABC transporter ATP-binding protein [Candidatus Neomarinimicrobiota bacterium]
MNQLNINNITMRFSGVVALKGVSLAVEDGEIFSLIGPNGSGKSTLFNCINGFNRPQEGGISYNGANLLKTASHNVIEAGISRTFQNIQNVPFMTVLDNVLLGAHSRIDNHFTLNRWLFKGYREKEEAMALEIMEFLGIANYESKYMSGQPYGIQKLVEIARALIPKPKMILMDEPAAGMNDQETFEIARIISEIRDKLGITVLVVEHDMNLVMSISDRIGVLDTGKIVTIGKPEEVKNHPEVLKAYLGEGFDA